MKVLVIHNRYQQPGGEDAVVESEVSLLKKENNEIKLFEENNIHITDYKNKIRTALNLPYSANSKSKVMRIIRDFKPQMVHVHNFFPVLTPSIYDACNDAGVPIVQTLHNYRTICANALLLRGGKVCELCINGSPYQAIFFRCYKNSFFGSWAVARMISWHQKKFTWHSKINRFIVLTSFAKDKFMQAGYPKDKIFVKPNFYNGEIATTKNPNRTGALYVGRLSQEKGVETLLKAWKDIDIPLKIAGDGPLMDNIIQHKSSFITSLGKISKENVISEMKKAQFLILPSNCYEGFPMVLVEAFAHGLPVIVSNLGSMSEIVTDKVTGLLFDPGNPDSLAQKVKWLFENPKKCREMGDNANQEYKRKYTDKTNYQQLMDLYIDVIKQHKSIDYV